jgi:hypothetical protein
MEMKLPAIPEDNALYTKDDSSIKSSASKAKVKKSSHAEKERRQNVVKAPWTQQVRDALYCSHHTSH